MRLSRLTSAWGAASLIWDVVCCSVFLLFSYLRYVFIIIISVFCSLRSFFEDVFFESTTTFCERERDAFVVFSILVCGLQRNSFRKARKETDKTIISMKKQRNRKKYQWPAITRE